MFLFVDGGVEHYHRAAHATDRYHRPRARGLGVGGCGECGAGFGSAHHGGDDDQWVVVAWRGLAGFMGVEKGGLGLGGSFALAMRGVLE